jgi:hypothetical protein
MASDTFTDTNFTPIEDHTSEGNTWAALGDSIPRGQISSNQLGFGESIAVGARATNSTSDFSQAVAKAGDYDPYAKSVHVRTTASNKGYQLQIGDMTGDIIDFIFLRKNESYLTHAVISGLSKSRLVDHTIAIKATQSGSDVELQGWLDGELIEWEDSSSADGTNSTTFTDLAADTPLPTGNPGLSVAFEANMDDANSRMDDWTDTEGGGGGGSVVHRSIGMGGGYVDMCGGLE